LALMPTARRAADGRWIARDASLLALTWTAGYVDALSFLGLGHVFTAMMTGNAVLFGIALGQGDGPAALRSFVALVAFALGALVGAAIVNSTGTTAPWPAAVTHALLLEALVFVAFIAIWHVSEAPRGAAVVAALIAALSFAMGIQSAAGLRLGVPGIATTYITGTLTTMMITPTGSLRVVARRSRARGDEPSPSAIWEHRIGLLSLVVVVYAFGALVGGVLETRHSPLLTIVPLVVVVLVAGRALLGERRSAA
jgi:uncharacterized membrane protein YoaK (UPF0700 family)